MSVHSPLYTDDGRLRVAWRIALFLLVAVAVYVVAATLGHAIVPHPATLGARLILSSYITLVAGVVAHAIALQWIEPDRTWTFVGLGLASARPRQLAMGLLFGALAIGAPSVILLLTRALRIEPASAGSWWDAAWRAAMLLLPAAFVEELFLRGYIFAVLREAVGWKWTLIGTSVVFGALHMNNPGADAESVMLVVIAGFFLGAIILITRSLYAAWMAHFAWNWVMAGALHTAVSGLDLATPNYRTVSVGPTWLTGGAWGPEGGVAAGVSMLAFVLFFYARYLQPSDTTNRTRHD